MLGSAEEAGKEERFGFVPQKLAPFNVLCDLTACLYLNKMMVRLRVAFVKK